MLGAQLAAIIVVVNSMHKCSAVTDILDAICQSRSAVHLHFSLYSQAYCKAENGWQLLMYGPTVIISGEADELAQLGTGISKCRLKSSSVTFPSASLNIVGKESESPGH